MREILFRGKRIDNGEWVCSGSLIHFNKDYQHFIANLNDKCISTHDENDHIIAMEDTRIYKVIPETIGQYTGLTDKNGKKVFEGDIVLLGNNDKVYVEFCDFRWECLSKKHKYYRHTLENVPEMYEVIGNIHDNPELLKGGG